MHASQLGDHMKWIRPRRRAWEDANQGSLGQKGTCIGQIKSCLDQKIVWGTRIPHIKLVPQAGVYRKKVFLTLGSLSLCINIFNFLGFHTCFL